MKPLLALFQLADTMVKHHRGAMSLYRPMDLSQIDQELFNLVVELTGQPAAQLELLPLFCDDEACELLLCMPNRYWFWMAIRLAILEGALQKRITGENVATGLARYRREYTSKFNLQILLSDFTPAQAASRTAVGIILVRQMPFDHDEIVFNPIFAPSPNISGTFGESVAALETLLLRQKPKG